MRQNESIGLQEEWTFTAEALDFSFSYLKDKAKQKQNDV